MFTLAWPRITDNPTLFQNTQVIKHLLNLGVLEELLLVFLVYLEEVHTELVRELLEICVEEEECLLPPKLGEDGIERLMSLKEDTQSPLLLLLLPFLL